MNDAGILAEAARVLDARFDIHTTVATNGEMAAAVRRALRDSERLDWLEGEGQREDEERRQAVLIRRRAVTVSMQRADYPIGHRPRHEPSGNSGPFTPARYQRKGPWLRLNDVENSPPSSE